MAHLKLTDTERLILANQYEILAHIKKDDHCFLMAKTLREGYEWLYRHYFDVLGENLATDKAEHVLNILSIYKDMKDSFSKLSNKSGISEGLLNFPGFDGNNESELLGFANALQKHASFGSTIGQPAKDSHIPTTDIYERMIRKWEELGKPRFPYSREHIIAILEARIHPDLKK
jgi:uncharacterized protein